MESLKREQEEKSKKLKDLLKPIVYKPSSAVQDTLLRLNKEKDSFKTNYKNFQDSFNSLEDAILGQL